MIAGLPQGPAGMVVFVGTVVVLGVLVMSIVPALSWIDRRRARRKSQRIADAISRGQVEAMGVNESLLMREASGRAKTDNRWH